MSPVLEAAFRLSQSCHKTTHFRKEERASPLTGRAKECPPEKVLEMRRLERAGLTRKEISKLMNFSHVTVTRKLGRKYRRRP